MRARSLALGLVVLAACQKQEREPPKPAPVAPAAVDAAVAKPTPPPPPAATRVHWVHPQKLLSIKFPGKPKESESEMDTPGGPVRFTMAIHARAKSAYMAVATEYKLVEGMTFDVQKALDGARDKMVADVGGKVTAEKPIALDGFAGREVAFEGAGPNGVKIKAIARIFVGSEPPAGYIASAFRMTEEADADAMPFLDSLHLGKAIETAP